jgi:hypothetical protein
MSKGNDAAERYLEGPLLVAGTYTGRAPGTGHNIRSNLIRAHSLMMLCSPRLQGLTAGGSSWRGHEFAPRSKDRPTPFWSSNTNMTLAVRT